MTRISFLLTLSFSRTAEFGAVETAPQFIQVLRTHSARLESGAVESVSQRMQFKFGAVKTASQCIQVLRTHSAQPESGAVKTAPQFLQVLRTHPFHPESDLSDFHTLRRDFNPRRIYVP
jgi:hypothetical protein